MILKSPYISTQNTKKKEKSGRKKEAEKQSPSCFRVGAVQVLTKP